MYNMGVQIHKYISMVIPTVGTYYIKYIIYANKIFSAPHVLLIVNNRYILY